MSAEKKREGFNFTISSDCWLSIDDIWPDGDAPDNPTVDHVHAVIEQCGGAKVVIREWNLDEDLALAVEDKVCP